MILYLKKYLRFLLNICNNHIIKVGSCHIQYLSIRRRSNASFCLWIEGIYKTDSDTNAAKLNYKCEFPFGFYNSYKVCSMSKHSRHFKINTVETRKIIYEFFFLFYIIKICNLYTSNTNNEDLNDYNLNTNKNWCAQ